MADSDDPLVNGKPLSSLRVVDLKKECDKRNLSKSGSKSQLLERLKTQLLIENLGQIPVDENVRAPNQKLQEEECQNEFIKQYLERQKQLIEMNSSSQESDHSGDESTRKRPPPVEEPVKVRKSSSTVEISPEKASQEKQVRQEIGAGDSADNPTFEKPADKSEKTEKLKPETPEKGVESSPKPPAKPVEQTDIEEPATKVTEEPSKVTEEKKETQEQEAPEVMGRSRRRLSRMDESETKSEEKTESKSRRSRSSRSSGSEDVKKAENTPTEKKNTETTEENKENAGEPMKVAEKEKQSETSKGKEAKKDVEKSSIEKQQTSKEQVSKMETDKTSEESISKESIIDNVTKEQESEDSDSEEMEIIETNPDNKVVNKVDQVQEKKTEKESPAVEKKTQKQEDVMSRPRRQTRGSSSSRSRSRSGSPPAGPRRKMLKKLSEPVQDRRKRSSSSSSSDDISKKSKQKRRYSSSSSSSRSRSRSKSPAQKKLKKPENRTSRKDKKKGKSRSSSSSGSRSRSPPKAALKKKKSRSSSSSSSSSRSRSRSPPVKQQLKGQVQKKTAPAAAVEKVVTPETKKTKMEVEKNKQKSPTEAKKQEKPMEAMETNSKAQKGETVPAEESTKTAAEPRVSRKISLNRKPMEESVEAEKGAIAEEGQEEKPTKRRKWGSRSTTNTQKPKKISNMAISTESLKSLIPEIKPALKLAPEPILEDEMDYEDDPITGETALPTQDAEDTRSVKIQRTVTQDVKDNPDSPTGSESGSDKEEEVEKQESSGGEEEKGEQEPAEGESGEATQQKKDKREIKEDKREIKEDKREIKEDKREIIKAEVKEEEKEKQTITKTITLTKKEKKPEIKVIRRLDSKGPSLVKPDEPEKPRRSPSPARNPVSKLIHIRNLVRPFTLNQLKELLSRTGTIEDKTFWIDKIKSHCFVTYETEDQAVETRQALHNTRWPQSNPKTLMVDFASDDQLEYYRGDEKPIPPPEKKAAMKEKEQREKERQQRLQEEKQRETERRAIEREKRMKERLEREAREKAKPVREWDRDKKSREDWDRTMQRSKSRSPRRRRSRSGSASRERRRRSREEPEKREKKKEKKEDEPPAKLLDDLFRKTKATPCIYWLPLTAVQVAEKEKLNIKKPILRQKQGGDLASPLRDPSSPDSDTGEGRRPAGRSPLRRSMDRGRDIRGAPGGGGRDRRPRTTSDSRSRGDRRR